MAEASADTGLGAGAMRQDSLLVRRQRAWQDAQDAWARAQATWALRAEAMTGVSKNLLTVSPLARLRAQVATMPVIEQAKGILMAQQGCREAEAFELLRRASQRSNIPVRELAAQIVHSAQEPARASA